MKINLVILIIFLVLTPIAIAEEAPKYNFGTTAASSTILIEPGENLKVPAINFFNLYGNRITHVSLSLTDSPKGWDVKIEPELHEVQVNISGTIVTSSENLYVSPSNAVAEKPAVPDEDTAYITIGGIEGYVPAKVAYLNITAPPGVPLGGSYTISMRAVGSWYGQAANLALSQERSFQFKVQTVTHTFSEEIVKPGEIEKKPDYSMYIIALIVVIAIAGGFYAGRKKK
jgi:hypothetical protein